MQPCGEAERRNPHPDLGSPAGSAPGTLAPTPNPRHRRVWEDSVTPPCLPGLGSRRGWQPSRARCMSPPRLRPGVQRTRINMMQIGRLSQAPQAGGLISTQPSAPAGRSGNNNNNTDNQGNWQGRPPPSPSVHTSEAGRRQRRGAAQVSELQQGGPERPRPTPEVALRVTGRPGAEI